MPAGDHLGWPVPVVSAYRRIISTRDCSTERCRAPARCRSWSARRWTAPASPGSRCCLLMSDPPRVKGSGWSCRAAARRRPGRGRRAGRSAAAAGRRRSSGGRRRCGRRARRAGHQVEHHVEPLPGRRLQERGGGVVDDPVRAVGADPVGAARAAGRGHGGTGLPGELDGVPADRAARSVDQDGV